MGDHQLVDLSHHHCHHSRPAAEVRLPQSSAVDNDDAHHNSYSNDDNNNRDNNRSCTAFQ